MIFITGATGTIGAELCQLLAAAHIPTRAMCRKEAQLVNIQSMGLEAVVANFDDATSMKTAMQGCDKLFLLTSPNEHHIQREKQLIDIAVSVGIQQMVRISTADANLSSRLSYAQSHAAVDHYLRSQPISWTILRATGFMQNFLESGFFILQGKLPHAMQEGQISYVDARDIALVAKHVLTESTHHKAIYFLTGMESLTVEAVADQLTTHLGFEVTPINITKDAMHKNLTYAGLSEWHIDALLEQFAIGANGCEIDVTEDIERITGKPPRRFAQFVKDYKQQFAKH